MKSSFPASILPVIFGLVFASGGFAQAPQHPPPVITAPAPPVDVAIPAGFPANANPIAFFDDFSWRSFIALVWPAKAGQRGQPDTSMKVGGQPAGKPLVFETYKALYEVFHVDGSAPTADYNGFDAAKDNPCNVAEVFGDLTLGSFSKFSDLGQAGIGSLVGPLIAQNVTYVRFVTGYNESDNEKIVKNQWYVRNNLPKAPATATFDNGAIDVKSAWMDMAHISHPERYYAREAYVLNPTDGTTSKITVGLVGLHIVQKTPTRPQWIWSTFEQVDNAPTLHPTDEPGASAGPFNFNDGSATAMPINNPYQVNQVLNPPTLAPYNVTRVTKINPSTQSTNTDYQKALQSTVWKNYKLVMTQWPLIPGSPGTDGTPANTFPGSGDHSSAFANTTMETFDQTNINKGCMSCHNATASPTLAQTPTDFLWSLNDHAFPPKISTPNLFMQDHAVQELRNLIQNETPP